MKVRTSLGLLALLFASLLHATASARTSPRASRPALVERFGIQQSDFPRGYTIQSSFDPGFANELNQTVLRGTATSASLGNAVAIEITMWGSAAEAGLVFTDFVFSNDGTGHYASAWNPGGVGDQEKGQGGAPVQGTAKTCLMGPSSGYYLLFRRGPVLVLIQGMGCKGGIDPKAIARVGRLIDGRITRNLKSA